MRNESNRRFFGGLHLELSFYESEHELGKTNPDREGTSMNTKNYNQLCVRNDKKTIWKELKKYMRKN